MSKVVLTRMIVALASLSMSGTAAAEGNGPSEKSHGDRGLHSSAECGFVGLHVEAVRPYRLHEQYARPVLHQLAGADIFVSAEPGVTLASLQQQLDSHLEQIRQEAKDDCPLDVAGAHVEVHVADGGYRVRVIARTHAHAAEVLRRAQDLLN